MTITLNLQYKNKKFDQYQSQYEKTKSSQVQLVIQILVYRLFDSRIGRLNITVLNLKGKTF